MPCLANTPLSLFLSTPPLFSLYFSLSEGVYNLTQHTLVTHKLICVCICVYINIFTNFRFLLVLTFPLRMLGRSKSVVSFNKLAVNQFSYVPSSACIPCFGYSISHLVLTSRYKNCFFSMLERICGSYLIVTIH